MSIFLVSNPIHKDVNTWTLARKEKDNSFPQGCLCLQQKSEELWQGDWNWIIRWWLSCKMFDWANNQLWLWLWPSLERFEHVQPSLWDPTTLSRRTYQSLAWKPKLSGSSYHLESFFCKLSFFPGNLRALAWRRWLKCGTGAWTGAIIAIVINATIIRIFIVLNQSFWLSLPVEGITARAWWEPARCLGKRTRCPLQLILQLI